MQSVKLCIICQSVKNAILLYANALYYPNGIYYANAIYYIPMPFYYMPMPFLNNMPKR